MQHWFQAYSGASKGLVIRPFAFDASMVSIVSIGRSLSHQCRFAGHVKWFYSVAEHLVRASHIPGHPHGQRCAFGHDIPESVLQDIIRPLKKHPGMSWYADVETHVMNVFAEAFGLWTPGVRVERGTPPSLWVNYTPPHVVGIADEVMLAVEKRDLLEEEPQPWADLPDVRHERRVRPLPPELAEVAFLERFVELFDDVSAASRHVDEARARLKTLWWARARLMFRKVVLGWRP